MFNEICIYEAKIEKQDEIEELMREVVEFYRSLPGVIEVRYIKRTHRQKDFNAVKAGEPPIRLTRQVGKVFPPTHLPYAWHNTATIQRAAFIFSTNASSVAFS